MPVTSTETPDTGVRKVTLCLPESELKALDEARKGQHLSRSMAVRLAVKGWLPKETKNR